MGIVNIEKWFCVNTDEDTPKLTVGAHDTGALTINLSTPTKFMELDLPAAAADLLTTFLNQARAERLLIRETRGEQE
jgi:hypothetical protein